MRTYEETERLKGEADTEITLGMTSILGIFFGLALICGVFFGFGYSLGRGNTIKPSASAPITETPSPTAPSASTAQPSPLKTVVEGASSWPGAYNYVAGSGGPARIPAGATVPAKPSASEVVVAQSTTTLPAAVAPAVQTQTVQPNSAIITSGQPKAASISYPAQPAATPPTNIMVQIAAVSRRDDADALVAALRKLGYDASARAEQGDNLLHVQIGPFSTVDQAKAMRTRLLSDGYNAILK